MDMKHRGSFTGLSREEPDKREHVEELGDERMSDDAGSEGEDSFRGGVMHAVAAGAI